MAFTAADILEKVRDVLNEAVAAFWSDAELERYIAEGTLDVSVKTGCVETHGAITLGPNTLAYPIPATFTDPPLVGILSLVKIHAVLYNGQALAKIHPRMLAQVHDTTVDDTPLHWAHFGTQIYIAPTGPNTAGDVLLLCSVSTDDVIDLPDAWQLLPVLYAASRAKVREGTFDEALVLYSEYLNSLTFQRNDVLERGVTSRAELTVPDDVVTPNG